MTAWCTISALVGTPLQDVAARAVLALFAFVRLVKQLADATNVVGTGPPMEFQDGKMRATSLTTGRPVLDHPPVWRAIVQMMSSEQQLSEALADGPFEPLLEG